MKKTSFQFSLFLICDNVKSLSFSYKIISLNDSLIEVIFLKSIYGFSSFLTFLFSFFQIPDLLSKEQLIKDKKYTKN